MAKAGRGVTVASVEALETPEGRRKVPDRPAQFDFEKELAKHDARRIAQGLRPARRKPRSDVTP